MAGGQGRNEARHEGGPSVDRVKEDGSEGLGVGVGVELGALGQ